jgi:hypothetical protein
MDHWKECWDKKREEVRGGWINLHDVTLQDLYFSAHKLFRRSNKREWDWNGDIQWAMRNGYNTLVVQLCVRTRSEALNFTPIWEYDIKIRSKDTGSNQGNIFVRPCTGWIPLGHFRIEWQAPASTTMHSWCVLRAANFVSSWATRRFPSTTVPHAAKATQWVRYHQSNEDYGIKTWKFTTKLYYAY